MWRISRHTNNSSVFLFHSKLIMIHANNIAPAVQWFHFYSYKYFLNVMIESEKKKKKTFVSFLCSIQWSWIQSYYFLYTTKGKKLINKVKRKKEEEIEETRVLSIFALSSKHTLTHTHTQNGYMRVDVLLLFCTILF